MNLQPKPKPDPTAAEGFDNWDWLDPLFECAEPWTIMFEHELAAAWDMLDICSQRWFGVDYTELSTDDQRVKAASAVETFLAGGVTPGEPVPGPWDYARLETNSL